MYTRRGFKGVIVGGRLRLGRSRARFDQLSPLFSDDRSTADPRFRLRALSISRSSPRLAAIERSSSRSPRHATGHSPKSGRTKTDFFILRSISDSSTVTSRHQVLVLLRSSLLFLLIFFFPFPFTFSHLSKLSASIHHRPCSRWEKKQERGRFSFPRRRFGALSLFLHGRVVFLTFNVRHNRDRYRDETEIGRSRPFSFRSAPEETYNNIYSIDLCVVMFVNFAL